MTIENINEDSTIEDLVTEFPPAVRFLMERGIRCLRCGEPIWGTLKEAALEKGFSEDSLPGLVTELQHYLKSDEEPGETESMDSDQACEIDP